MAKKAIVGEKVGMTQIWDDQNRVIPVTVLRIQPARVVQIRTPEEDGYSAVQVTYGNKDASKLNKAAAGQFDKAGVAPGKRLVELRLDDVNGITVGQELGTDLFEAGEFVDVTGQSKGKGFAGTIKRHNFTAQPNSHGAKRVHRKPGSVGQCATPGRVFKGKRMPGRMGAERVTTLNLEIVRADAEQQVVLVRGSVPGPRGGVVILRDAIKAPSAGGNN